MKYKNKYEMLMVKTYFTDFSHLNNETIPFNEFFNPKSMITPYYPTNSVGKFRIFKPSKPRYDRL